MNSTDSLPCKFVSPIRILLLQKHALDLLLLKEHGNSIQDPDRLPNTRQTSDSEAAIPFVLLLRLRSCFPNARLRFSKVNFCRR